MQLVELGLHFVDYPGGGFVPVATSWAGALFQVEVGYHLLSKHHDGLVVGLRQAVVVTELHSNAGGSTTLRVGYDVAVQLGSMELNIDPYGVLGIGYANHGPDVGLAFAVGVEAKLFLVNGFYAFARPIEVGGLCFTSIGDCFLNMLFGAGGGVAF